MEENEMELTQTEQEILRHIRADYTRQELKSALDDYHDADIAQILDKLDSEERRKLYRTLGVQRMSDIFAYLDDVEDYFHEIGLEKSADILEEMDADDAVDVLETLPEEYREQLIKRMDSEAKEDIQLIASYDDDEIGSLMTTNMIEIVHGANTREAMKELIRQSEDNDNISTLYFINPDGTFFGAMELPDLIRARKDTDLDEFITTSYPTVNAHAKISDEIERLRSYSEDSIPVLDDSGVLIGAITAFDVVEAVDDEMGEDYAKFAGLTAEEDLNEGLFASLKKRLPWLLALLVLGLVVSSVVGVFEAVVREIALIVCFQSLILDMAGNVGTQSLAVTIRVLVDENITGRQKAAFVFKEGRIGFVNGLILGLGSFALIGLYIMLAKGFPAGYSFTISACVGLALFAAMVISSLMGTLIPMFFHKLKVDPAAASGPLITTVNDLVAVVTYYGLAWGLLINVMHITH